MKRTYELRTCALCATSFSARRDTKTRFCSMTCAANGRRKGWTLSPEARQHIGAAVVRRYADPAERERNRIQLNSARENIVYTRHPVAERFAGYIQRAETCWLWTG